MANAKKVHTESSVMDQLLEEHGIQVKQFHPGELVEGVVISVSHEQVLLDIGAKAEGVVSGSELGDSILSARNLEPGDTALAAVVQPENSQGYVVLSFKRCEKDRQWKIVEDAFENEIVLDVKVQEYNKGGLLVDCMGLRGFVPLSHLDRVHFAEDIAKFAAGSEAELKESLKVLEGKELKVKVIEVDMDKNRLVLSEKEATRAYSDEARQEKLEKIEVGDILTGIVTGLMPFGIFVDLEGVEGLVHISEIAWEKVNNPGNYYKVGEKIEVKVLGIDEDSGKLALSVKRLIPNPWEDVQEKYPVGTKITGTVSRIVPFGAFVTVEQGLEGLIHVSEASGPLEAGEEVEAIVTLVDSDNQKLALSTRLLEKMS
ncbi:S1 RNA-binding domain-containing protein [candidate division WWE3 bacterium]|nr:S1 RNA-binding domain-containing protein [candidate division WWE3 bacterium]